MNKKIFYNSLLSYINFRHLFIPATLSVNKFFENYKITKIIFVKQITVYVCKQITDSAMKK